MIYFFLSYLVMALCFVLSKTLKSLTQLHNFSVINGVKQNSTVVSVIYNRRQFYLNMSDQKTTKEKEKPSSTSSSSHDDDGDRESSGFSVESLRRYLADKLGFYVADNEKSEAEKILEDLSFDGLMKHWKEKGFKKIITMVGAGISTSAGIPDFRSPGSGLYHNLEKYNLPHPTAIFQMDYFYENPKPFFVLAKELYPGSFKPTPCHYFVKLLNEKGWLLRHYTQNIDTLERVAGIPEDKIVEAHGTFYTNHCLGCRKEFSMEWMKEQIFDDVVPTCDKCNGIIKPDIVFFGENLPDKFHELPSKDFRECDLLIIMGTSLEVQPFASLVDRTNDKCLRLLINREKVGKKQDLLSSFLLCGGGLSFDEPDNRTDIAWIGDCDDGVQAIADAIGIGDELKEMVKTEHAKIDEQMKAEKKTKKSEEGSSKES